MERNRHLQRPFISSQTGWLDELPSGGAGLSPLAKGAPGMSYIFVLKICEGG